MSSEAAPKCSCPSPIAPTGQNEPAESCMKQRCWGLLQSSFRSDVSFIVGKRGGTKTFSAHTNLLAAGSSVFRTMFNGNWEFEKPIKVTDVQPSEFAALLRFLYTDEVHLSVESAVKIHYVAKKYDVVVLKNRCLTYVKEKLSPGNVFTLLGHAIDQTSFHELDRVTLSKILERDTLNASEDDVFRAVMKWAKSECEKQNIVTSAENCRAVLGDTILLIRFPLMTRAKFYSVVVPSNILTDEQLLQMLLYFAGQKRDSFNFSTTHRQHPTAVGHTNKKIIFDDFDPEYRYLSSLNKKLLIP